MHIFTKMKKDLMQKIEIPEGVEVNVDGTLVNIKGSQGENKRGFNIKKIKMEKTENEIKIECKNASKKEKKLMNSMTTHIKNMIQGVQEKFEYKLKICNSHFPMKVDVKGKEVEVKNFLGEKIPRIVQIPENVEVKIDGDIISVSSVNKEFAGQGAANFEKATRVPSKDRRIFQDGIFIINKAGREI